MKKAFVKGSVVVVFLLGSIGLSGCDLLYSLYDNMMGGDTGAWKEGSFVYRGYWIVIEGPNAGCPSGEIDWSTHYDLEDGTKVNVNLTAKEGTLEDRIAEEAERMTVSEGILWDNSCYFYYDEEDDGEPITVALLEVGEENHLEIRFDSYEDEVVLFEEIPDTFALTIKPQ